MPFDPRLRPADFTAILIAVALLALYLFAQTPLLMHLYTQNAGWVAIITIILGFFGLGTLLHSAVQACRIQFRIYRPKN